MKNIKNNLQDALDGEAIDFAMWKDSGNHHAERWDTVQKRPDAEEWFWEVCPEGIQTHTQKEAQVSWYPVIEE